MAGQHETHTPDLPRRFRLTFKARLVLLFAGVCANILILADIVDVVPGVIVFSGSVVLYAVLTLLYWRCPHCTAYPGNAVMPDYCEKCGRAIFGLDAHVADLPPGTKGLGIRMRYLLLGRLLYGITLLTYFVLLAPLQSHQPVLFWSGALALVAGGGWLEWRWWRCPHCGGYLRRSLWPGKVCLKCGTPFRF